VLELEADELIEQVALELRRPADIGDDVDAAVMAAIRSAPLRLSPPVREPAPAPRRAWAWLVQPRTLRVSPIGGLAAAAAVALLVVGARRVAVPAAGGESTASEAVASAPAATAAGVVRHDTVHVTHFMLVAPGANSVSVVGDFNDWDGDATPLRLASDKSGVWSVELPLPPGRYKYTFLVDGVRWVADPVAPRAVDSDFGTPNSVITVRGADT
jgi:hypothetical protein